MSTSLDRTHSRLLRLAATVLGGFFVTFLQSATAEDQNPATENRVAFVVSATQYQHLPPLLNPGNDAATLSALLAEAGLDFQVSTSKDQPRIEFDAGFKQFLVEAEGADLALFYFAGHGFELDGVNYLMPIDAPLLSGARMPAEYIKLTELLQAMGNCKAANKVLILDCCRNLPFPDQKFAGMADVQDADIPSNTMIMFAAEPGNVALDGLAGNPNSPFAVAIAKEFQVNWRSLFDSFLAVSSSVKSATRDQQEPWVRFYGSAEAFRTYILKVPPVKLDQFHFRVCHRITSSSGKRALAAFQETLRNEGLQSRTEFINYDGNKTLMQNTIIEDYSLSDIVNRRLDQKAAKKSYKDKRVYYPVSARPILAEIQEIWPLHSFEYIERKNGSKQGEKKDLSFYIDILGVPR